MDKQVTNIFLAHAGAHAHTRDKSSENESIYCSMYYKFSRET